MRTPTRVSTPLVALLLTLTLSAIGCSSEDGEPSSPSDVADTAQDSASGDAGAEVDAERDAVTEDADEQDSAEADAEDGDADEADAEERDIQDRDTEQNEDAATPDSGASDEQDADVGDVEEDDAGESDAEGADAANDTGSDAGEADAGPSDVSESDATETDATESDAGADVSPDDAVSDADAATDAGEGDASADAASDASEGDASADVADALADAGEDVEADTEERCGDLALPTTSIAGTEGITFAENGTFYYSQSQAVGRWSAASGANDSWITLRGANTVWGLVYRDSDRTLFVASPSGGGVIYRIPTRSIVLEAEAWVTDAGAPNGIALREDGTVYYSDFSGGHVYRVSESGTATRVTSRTIAQANGLYFDDDGSLLVLSYGGGVIYRLTLDAAGDEVSRVTEQTLPYALDGIIRDDVGRYYVTDNSGGQVIRMDENLENPEVIASGIGAAANLAFGRGEVECNGLYVASSGFLARLVVDGRAR